MARVFLRLVGGVIIIFFASTATAGMRIMFDAVKSNQLRITNLEAKVELIIEEIRNERCRRSQEHQR